MSLANDVAPSQIEESGFKRMSQIADAQESAGDAERGTTEQLGERIGLMQQMIEDEIRLRPFRALGWAAAAGLVVGFFAAR